MLPNNKLGGNIRIVYLENDPFLKLLFESEELLAIGVIENYLSDVIGSKPVMLEAVLIGFLIAKNDLIFVYDYSVLNSHERHLPSPASAGCYFLYNRISQIGLLVKSLSKQSLSICTTSGKLFRNGIGIDTLRHEIDLYLRLGSRGTENGYSRICREIKHIR